MDNKEEIKSLFLTAYFDKEINGYMIYLPDGTPLPGMMKVTISDNYDKEYPQCTAIFETKINISNINPADPY